eukprot:1286890-Rhodomonas_salina.1
MSARRARTTAVGRPAGLVTVTVTVAVIVASAVTVTSVSVTAFTAVTVTAAVTVTMLKITSVTVMLVIAVSVGGTAVVQPSELGRELAVNTAMSTPRRTAARSRLLARGAISGGRERRRAQFIVG